MSQARENVTKIVIADDHAVVRSGLRLLLDKEPDLQVVAEAGDMADAPRYVRAHRPRVLVLDLNMPGDPSLPGIPHAVFTDGGTRVPYDALIVAIGARAEHAFVNGHTFLADRWPEQLRSVWRDAADGYAKRIAFIAPPHAGWTLPLYEIALLTTAGVASFGQHPEMWLITDEPIPLAAFPGVGSEAVGRLLATAGIDVITGTRITGTDGRLLAASRLALAHGQPTGGAAGTEGPLPVRDCPSTGTASSRSNETGGFAATPRSSRSATRATSR